MEIKTLLMVLVGLMIVLLLTGCSYNHKQFKTEGSPLSGPDDFVIQVDDYGQFWDRAVPSRALQRIKDLSKTSNVIVVLLVHGWHHDAAPDDENLQSFAESVDDTRSRLIDESNPESAVYRQSRVELTGDDSLSVVSIYVGWRGRSLPWFLDYATFWGRKAAAERVGGGDLREFLGRLNALYREKRGLRATGATRHFLGLTSFGHSFGGQVLFRSVAYEIESELLTRTADINASGMTSTQVTDLIGFGDLVVLVNPAFEALQFERIWRLSTELEFGREQNPVILVVSSSGDVPRQVLFPIGRNLGAFLLRPGFRPGQKELWTQALGEYEPFRTHSIEIISDSSEILPGFDPSLYSNDPCAIASIDLTNLPAIAGVRLAPTERHRANNPFVIAYASTKVVLNHSKVFEKTLRKFLNDYIAIAQGKRMLTAKSGEACE